MEKDRLLKEKVKEDKHSDEKRGRASFLNVVWRVNVLYVLKERSLIGETIKSYTTRITSVFYSTDMFVPIFLLFFQRLYFPQYPRALLRMSDRVPHYEVQVCHGK